MLDNYIPHNEINSYITCIQVYDKTYLNDIQKFFHAHNYKSSSIISKSSRELIEKINALFFENESISEVELDELDARKRLLQSFINSIDKINKTYAIRGLATAAISQLSQSQSLEINKINIKSIDDITMALKGYLEKIEIIRDEISQKENTPQDAKQNTNTRDVETVFSEDCSQNKGTPGVLSTPNSQPMPRTNENVSESTRENDPSNAHSNLFFLIFYFFSTYLSPLLNSSLLYTRMIGHNDENQLPQELINPTKHSTSTQGNPDNKSLRVIDGQTPLFTDNNELSEKLTQEVKNLSEQFPNLPKNIKTLLSGFSCSNDQTIHDSISRLRSNIKKIQLLKNSPETERNRSKRIMLFGSYEGHLSQMNALIQAEKAEAEATTKTLDFLESLGTQFSKLNDLVTPNPSSLITKP